MATIKSHTDLEQSKKLAEFLPLESADSYYSWHDERYYIVNKDCPYPYSLKEKIPCWSLGALLKILKDYQLFSNGLIAYIDNVSYRIDSDNPVDACVEMIIKLNKQKLI